jgi:hypothetical protein
VSIPAIRRAFNTWKRWPRSGWNGWRISTQPKCDWLSSAVRSGRRYPQWPLLPIPFRYVSPLYRLRSISACLQIGLYPFEKLGHTLLLDGLQRHLIDARRSSIAAHPRPCSPQNVTSVNPVVQRMESSCPAPLGTHPQPDLELSYFIYGVVGRCRHALALTPTSRLDQSRAPSLQRVWLHAFPGTMSPSDFLPAPSAFSHSALYVRSLLDSAAG